MNTDIRVFHDLSITFPEKEVYFRLGGHAEKNAAEHAFRTDCRNWCMDAFAHCHVQGRYRVLPVAEVCGDGLRLGNGYFLKSSSFASLCGGIRFLWCAAATAGAEIVNIRDSRSSVAESAVYDAVGSECADAAMDALQKLAERDLLREGRQLCRRRFSPGYGDMNLEVQDWFFQTLRMEEMGVTLFNHFMTPEKTVTAFAGIREIQETDQNDKM